MFCMYTSYETAETFDHIYRMYTLLWLTGSTCLVDQTQLAGHTCPAQSTKVKCDPHLHIFQSTSSRATKLLDLTHEPGRCLNLIVEELFFKIKDFIRWGFICVVIFKLTLSSKINFILIFILCDGKKKS